MNRTASASRYLEKVASLGCILCAHLGRGYSAAEIHHLREGQGAAQRGSDWTAVPLCPECHRGSGGLHGLGTRGFSTRYKLDELDLLSMTIAALNK